MAVAPTGAIYKSLNFDGKTSREFGVYITGEAVYNAPEREVEMISIPGRNGAFALDKGRFENIKVTYPAGIFADNEEDFAEAISNFRNYLCSRKGYCRLTDEYNPDEYREAVYKSGLEVDPALLRAGEFEIVFDCKPQRFLKSGETKQTIANSGDTIDNPTLFKSKPLLEVAGYGKISLDNASVEIEDTTIGTIIVYNEQESAALPSAKSIVFDDQYANVGDVISFTGMGYSSIWSVDNGNWTAYSVSKTGNISAFFAASRPNIRLNEALTYAYGTPKTDTVSAVFTLTSSVYGTLTGSLSLSFAYDGSHTITITPTEVKPSHLSNPTYTPTASIDEITLDSTQTALGNPLYIDLDIGEAYKIENNSVVSINNAVQLPAELPRLVPGQNSITFDNTITSLKLTPRWYEI